MYPLLSTVQLTPQLAPPLTTPALSDTFTQDLSPVGGSLALSALIGLLPLIVVFVLLGVVKTKAYVASLAGVATALLVAVLAYGMPASLAVLSATQGAVFGAFPIMWIVLCALWLYHLTVTSGLFEGLRATFDVISEDPRVQAVLIAFCFGGLLEALAGFGAPDIAALTAVARRRGVLSCVDNTFATPCYQRPLELGADLVMHSATKYFGGHSDVLGGINVVRDPELGKQLHLEGMAARWGTFVRGVSRFGIAARGIVFGTIAVLLARAAYTNNPNHSGGVGDSMRELTELGRWPYVAIAAGMVAYGVYQLIEAKYRRIEVT